MSNQSLKRRVALLEESHGPPKLGRWPITIDDWRIHRQTGVWPAGVDLEHEFFAQAAARLQQAADTMALYED